ncbi:MAG TPA: hypothetical protein VEJ47_17745 [Candidatus Eremiobacteraceae bacterium]|nr:hypothetical protein [Candidatus Eremiobacteraceae bacterium]
MAQSKDPYSNQGDGRDTPARQKLVTLRQVLLRIHKSLLDMERRSYEKEHGKVSAGELFRLVVDDPQFSWLHNISEFVVRIDEALTSEQGVTDADSHIAISLARKIFAPSETGDGFQKKYYDAIQRDPAVVMEHAELARFFNKEPTDSEGE